MATELPAPGRLTSRRRAALVWLGVLLALAAVGVGVAFVLFASWTDIRNATAADAQARIATVLQELRGIGERRAEAYLRIDAEGHVHVQRELEGDTPATLDALHLLVWESKSDRLLEVALPYWFVRVKMTDRINLGTWTTALSGDWENLDLRVSVHELRRRGPGLVLDHTLQDGTRLLLWSTTGGSP